MMFNFVALASENPWLANLNVEQVNKALAARRTAHASLVASGDFWRLDRAAKVPLLALTCPRLLTGVRCWWF